MLSERYNVDTYDIGSEEPNKMYDCVILSHVLEHIYDINSFLNKLNLFVNNNGYIYIEIPNAEYFTESNYICPLQEINLEHINFFSKFSLAKLMVNKNYVPLKIIDDFFIQKDHKYNVIRGIFKKNHFNDSFIEYINNGKNKINNINISGYNNLYIYGNGEFLYKIFDKLNNNNKIINIVDDNPNYKNKKIKNIKIINFNDFKNNVNDGDNVIISSTLAYEIIKNKIKTINKQINIIDIVF